MIKSYKGKSPFTQEMFLSTMHKSTKKDPSPY